MAIKSKLVLIEWEDAFSPESPAWMVAAEVDMFVRDSQFKCRTVGWMVHEDERMITVASQRNWDFSAMNHLQRIPKGCVTKITKLQ